MTVTLIAASQYLVHREIAGRGWDAVMAYVYLGAIVFTPLAAADDMFEWTEPITRFIGQKVDSLWIWFDALSREEWLIVLAACCAVGFLMLKSWGKRGPC